MLSFENLRHNEVVVQGPSSLRSRPLLEIALTFSLIMIALWTPRPTQDWVSVIALLWIVGSTLFDHRSREDLTWSGSRGSLWIVPAALVIAGIEILIASHEHALQISLSASLAIPRITGYAVWSLLQQFILQNYFFMRLLRVFRPGWALVISASLFAVAHVPNPVLTLATLIWGLAACALFRRYRDLLSLGLAHAVFGLTLAMCIPASVHHNMRVGLGYLRYHPKPQNQRSQMPQIVSTDAWVITEAAARRSSLQARP
jgi:membrane protease YdiL (CAAX protease family)